MKKKQVLITGIAGFIGYHVALFLHDRGDKVIGIDAFTDDYDPSLKRLRASRLKLKNIPILEIDIANTSYLKKELEKYTFTHVLHLAAKAGVRASFKQHHPYVHSNLVGFVSLLEVVKKIRPVRFVYASSSSVYGKDPLPFKETSRADRPGNLYAATKRAGELLATSYEELWDIPCCGLRYFTVYGPCGRPDMAYYLFAKKLLEEDPIDLFGQGRMERDFTYIDDIVRGTVAALDQGKKGAIYNLASSSPKKVSYLLSLMEDAFQKKASVRLFPLPKGEIPITYGSISLAEKELGYFPKVSFEEGVANFCNWMKTKEKIEVKSMQENIT